MDKDEKKALLSVIDSGWFTEAKKTKEFARLVEDWIPADEILQRLCSLFEWNYKDIKRLADNTPNSKQKDKKLRKEQRLSLEGESDTSSKERLELITKELALLTNNQIEVNKKWKEEKESIE